MLLPFLGVWKPNGTAHHTPRSALFGSRGRQGNCKFLSCNEFVGSVHDGPSAVTDRAYKIPLGQLLLVFDSCAGLVIKDRVAEKVFGGPWRPFAAEVLAEPLQMRG